MKTNYNYKKMAGHRPKSQDYWASTLPMPTDFLPGGRRFSWVLEDASHQYAMSPY
jgi:hypothetical protein